MVLDYIVGFFVFIFGLCIGSFLNCVIYRLEKGEKISGRSYCPKCKKQLKWQDLFPVFSFLLLRGKCRYCKKPISWQYPLVELATAILFVLIFWNFGFNWTSVFILYVSCSLVVIFVYDLKRFIIPDKVLFPAIIVSAIYCIIPPHAMGDILKSILAVIIAAGFFFAIWAVSRGRWMGFGDVKFAILMGLLLGFPGILAGLFLAFFFGAIISLILLGFYGKSAGWRIKSEVPFGPFLVAGTFVAMFYGQQLINWYLNLII